MAGRKEDEQVDEKRGRRDELISFVWLRLWEIVAERR